MPFVTTICPKRADREERRKNPDYQKCSACYGTGRVIRTAFGDPGYVEVYCHHCEGTGYTKKIRVLMAEFLEKRLVDDVKIGFRTTTPKERVTF
jgi:excinuclease UvrABC ATPase subunit